MADRQPGVIALDLYLVRHGNSLSNAGLAGEDPSERYDSRLSPLGERQKDALPDPVNRWSDYTEETNYWTLVRPTKDEFVQPVTQDSFSVYLNLFDAALNSVGTRDARITFTDYDESVCTFDGVKCCPQGVGTTPVDRTRGNSVGSIAIRQRVSPQIAAPSMGAY